ncbi:NAD(P)/FAD-dependent oxidoreductase [Inhella gelatinilytica]|uniref:FAD-binding oxidoreductase n=1 Tax=Inhella gelatinilytica TaxID=2795030 RepID=A0A931IYU6_9BURK|nr:FAD-binding oxidoreductase [Inhella gelatinilytica]MBH9552331.1 FAD-binding oxidoreductase [Inhella gelatinilytica]
MPHEVLILGGGALGCAVAAALAARPDWGGRITVLERDPQYRQASSALSAASIRQQFSTPLNIALSQVGLDLLRRIGPAAAFQPRGYLYLAGTTAQADTLHELHAVQRAAGAPVQLLDRAALTARWPWLRTDDLQLGQWGAEGEGWFDGWGLLMHFKRQAQAAGVQFVTTEALSLERHADGSLARVHTPQGPLQADTVVLACGAWSGQLAASAGLDVPVHAKRRSVYAFTSPERAPGCPLVIDADPQTGLWFRPEGEVFLCGGPPLGADDDDLPLDPEPHLFEERLWPALAHRVPGFETLRPARAWAGYYEINPFDHNGWVGPLPECPGLLLACGFSGHGLQHAAGVGRGVAEWIATGTYQTLDLSPLAPARLRRGERLVERNVI